MLCITVAPESRRLGRVDLHNAAPQCDLIELRLDRLGKTPDLRDMLQGIDKPVLISCRRRRDGGIWQGSEDERLQMLRTAIALRPAYIELELDVADQVPRFGNTQRVVSYTQLDRPLRDLETLYNKARDVQADVVKFVGPTPTLSAARPLLAAIGMKRTIPVVGMGLGKTGLMLSLLGCKYGSPWIYAALEKGLEAHAGQATVSDLENVYRWRDICPQTRFLAVAGFGETEATTVRILNAAFAQHQLNARCLSLEIGKPDKFLEMLDILHINVLLANPATSDGVVSLADQLDEGSTASHSADLLVKQPGHWAAYNMIWRSVLRAIEVRLGALSHEDHPLEGRDVLLVGSDETARSIAFGVQRRRGRLSVTGADATAAQHLAQSRGARHVPLANLYDTHCDVVILTGAHSTQAAEGTGVALNPSLFRPNLVVADVSRFPEETDLLREARLRGCRVVEPAEIYADYLSSLFRTITGKDLPRELVGETLPLQAVS